MKYPSHVVCFTIFFSFLLSALNVQVLASDTEAETAAITQRKLLPDEVTRLRTACQLSFTGDFVDLSSTNQHVPLVRFSDFRILPLIVVHVKNGKTLISKYDDLPKGGIGARDNCAAVLLERFPPFQEMRLGWWLRPGLNLEIDYPSTYSEIIARHQLIDLSSITFAAVKSEKEKLESSDLPNLLSGEKIDAEGFHLKLRGYFLLQAKTVALKKASAK